MMGVFDSFAQIATVLITGAAAVAVGFFKLWQRAKGREQQAKQQVDQLKHTIGKVERVHEADRAAEQAGAEREQEVVEQAKTGRRDHFENTR